VQVADFVLSAALLAVMVAVPALTAVTVPLLTVATPLLLLDHVTFLFVALLGATVATSVSLLPTVRLVDGLLSVTPVTATLAEVTVTVAVSLFVLSAWLVALIVAVVALLGAV
jgi:hypothetical protein